MKQNNTFQEMIKPLLVLVVICLVVSALLGFTNSVTAPIVEENERIAAEQTRKAVLAGAESFTEIECDAEALGITSAYKEDSGKVYVFTAARKGYGGEVVVTVGAAPHPMLDAHYIEWVSLQTKAGNQRKALRPRSEPTVCFPISEGDEVEAVYAYCNLHGLWKA